MLDPTELEMEPSTLQAKLVKPAFISLCCSSLSHPVCVLMLKINYSFSHCDRYEQKLKDRDDISESPDVKKVTYT